MTSPTLADLDLEREVLGSCVVYPELLRAIDLSAEDFTSRAHRDAWSALVFLAAEGDAVDTLRLQARLADMGRLEACGGPDFALDLTSGLVLRNPPTDRLRRLTKLRHLREATQRAVRACETEDLDQAVSELASAHSAALRGSAERRTQNLMELCEGLVEELRDPTARPLVHPGYEMLATHLGSLEPGTTVGVLADTNVGKSSVCLEALLRAAAEHSVVSGYLSVEDQDKRVRARLVSMLSGVSSRKLLQRRLSADEFNRVAHAFDEIDRLKHHMHVSTLQGGTDSDVCAAMSELAARGCKLVAVDYVQKVSSSKSYASRAHECANIASRITSHAQRLGVVLFLASQCTRDKNRQNECPSKHDMKESGDLENMLDAIIGLWREREDDFSPVWVRVLKSKDGGVGRAWSLQRDVRTGRLEEVFGSDNMQPPDRKGSWAHRRTA